MITTRCRRLFSLSTGPPWGKPSAVLISSAHHGRSMTVSPASLSTAECNAQGRHDTRDRERKAAKTHPDHCGEFGPGVYIILDHNLQAERSVIEESDQKQDHR